MLEDVNRKSETKTYIEKYLSRKIDEEETLSSGRRKDGGGGDDKHISQPLDHPSLQLIFQNFADIGKMKLFFLRRRSNESCGMVTYIMIFASRL